MNTPSGGIRLRGIFQGGESNYRNYIALLVQAMQQPSTLGISAITGEKNISDYATMDEVMFISLSPTDTLNKFSKYTNTSAHIGKDSRKLDYYFGAEKVNKCPLILARKKTPEGTHYLIWHLDYMHTDSLARPQEAIKEIKSFLPRQFKEGDAEEKKMFSDQDVDIMVTDSRLLSSEIFNCVSRQQALELPDGLRIVGSGLEGSIRSYDIAYFPFNDILVISGYNKDNIPYFWAMKDPFSGQQKWQELRSCELVLQIAKALSDSTAPEEIGGVSGFLEELRQHIILTNEKVGDPSGDNNPPSNSNAPT
jgi:hypothetical protein